MAKSRESSTVVVGGALFAASVWWALRKLRHQKKNSMSVTRVGSGARNRGRMKTGAAQRERFSIMYTDRTSGDVGSRGEAALSPPIPYLEQFLVCLENLCDPARNYTGYIPLAVAENRLVLDMLADRFMRVGTATAAFSDPSVYCYQSFLGLPLARDAVAYFLARRFLFPDDPDLEYDRALTTINPKHVALASGAASILNSLFFLLGEAGDACLIPSPYYAAFENDMSIMAGIVPVPIEQANPTVGPTEAELNAAYAAARGKGLSVKFILVTNPNNPLGIIYSQKVMLGIVRWARKHRMHTLVDEIYALGVHSRHRNGFESIIRILNNDLRTDVHFLWALSKDFGGSGLRVGLVYSQNEIFIEGLATVNIFSCVSGPIQYMISEILTDDQFIDSFLEESRNRLVYSYHICAAKLEEMVVPYVHAEAGMFVYIDLSSLLPEKTFEGEERLADIMFEFARVVLTPGESQRDTKPGMFRICYAWVSVEILQIAMERLSRLVAKIRRMDWDDLNERSLAGIL